MIKALITAAVCAVLGIGLGMVQASFSHVSSEERFSISRPPLAVRRNETTDDAIVDQTKTQGKPKVEVVGDTEFDFGSMMHGSEMSHSFKFRNVGDGPLILEMGESSCKCTVGDLDKSILEPGEETDVTLTWHAFTVTRDFGQNAIIKTNDVENLEVKLVVFGQITEVVTTVPKTLEMDDISDVEGAERKIMVYAYSEDIESLQQFTWTDGDTEDLVEFDYHEVDLAEITDAQHKNAKRAFELTFRILPGFPLGRLGSRIQFRTNLGEDLGTIEIPVSGRATGTLDLAGGPSFDAKRNVVKLGNVKQSEGREVSIVLLIQGENRADIIPEVKSVYPEESLEVEIGDPVASDTRIRYPVIFRVPKGAPEVYLPARGPDTHGVVVLKTSGGLDRELRVFVQLKVTR